jgi:hypothetical protein
VPHRDRFYFLEGGSGPLSNFGKLSCAAPERFSTK